MARELSYRVIISKYNKGSQEIISVWDYDSYNQARSLMIKVLSDLGSEVSGRIEEYVTDPRKEMMSNENESKSICN